MNAVTKIVALSFLLLIPTTNSEWITKSEKYRCPTEPVTQYDALGRRQSGYLVPPENQGSCGSCWAFAGAHTFADQININSNSSRVQFSPDHLTRCSPYSGEGNGCCGGSVAAAGDFFKETGAFPNSCFSYTLEEYAIPEHLKNDDEKRIRYKNANPLMCPRACDNGDSIPSPQRLHSFSKVGSNPSEVIAALNNGPLFVGMYVGAGITHLCNYGCGVLTDSVQLPLYTLSGGHAVEIVDYSSTSYPGTPFYVIKNSWGESWGEQGYFRIQRDSRLLMFPSEPQTYVYSFATGPNSNNQETSMPNNLLSTCAPVKVNATQNLLVNNSVTFALNQVNTLQLLNCLSGQGKANVQLTSVINATEQVVAGMIADIALNVAVSGCEEKSAIVRVVVMENINGSLTLLDYSYNPSPTNAATLHTYSFGLLLSLMVIFGIHTF